MGLLGNLLKRLPYLLLVLEMAGDLAAILNYVGYLDNEEAESHSRAEDMTLGP